MAERVRVLLTEEEVDKRIQEIGEQISKDYEGKQVHLVCVLKGGSFFKCACFTGFYVCGKLRKRYKIQRCGKNSEGFG